jgi:3-oxoacyl-[acyl-carrier protein] reductase
LKIDGKTVLVTGAGGDLGKVICNSLVEDGAKVFALDKKAGGLKAIRKQGLSIFEADLTDSKKVEAVFEKIDDLDFLIQAAGVIASEPMFSPFSQPNRHSSALWQNVIDSNLKTCFLAGSFAIEHFIKHRKRGLIINIGSIMADGYAGQSAYAAAKAGVHAMTKVWAKELAIHKIRSVAVAPGFFDTESTRAALNQKVIDEKAKQIPSGALGNPSRLYHCIKMIIENDYINGTVIRLDGGLSGK